MKNLLCMAKRCVKLSNKQKAFKQLTCCNNGKLARSLWGLKEYFNNKSVNFIHSRFRLNTSSPYRFKISSNTSSIIFISYFHSSYFFFKIREVDGKRVFKTCLTTFENSFPF